MVDFKDYLEQIDSKGCTEYKCGFAEPISDL